VSVTAQLADGRTLEFPDGTDPAVVQATVRKMLNPVPATRAVTPQIGGVLGVRRQEQPPDAGARVLDAMERAPDVVGGSVTDALAGKVPAPMAGAAGYAANVATQAGEALAGGGAGRELAEGSMKGARWMMQSALKPTWAQLRTGKAARAIDTMLNEGLNATEGGVKTLKTKISDLNSEVQSLIANSTGVVNKSEVARTIGKALQDFKYRDLKDVDAIKSYWDTFKQRWFPADNIPVQEAQKIKQGVYQDLGDAAYGQQGAGAKEAQKAAARGLKEGIEQAEPDVIPLNAKQSELINALKVTERRALYDMNKNPMSLALLAHNPASFATFMADKSALFKSLVARMLAANKGVTVPQAAGQVAGGAVGMAQGQAGQ
jgi:hypothetical protein